MVDEANKTCLKGNVTWVLRADVSKYRPEVYKSEKLKNPKKIHRVALVELLSEIYFLFRFDDYYCPGKIILVSGLLASFSASEQ